MDLGLSSCRLVVCLCEEEGLRVVFCLVHWLVLNFAVRIDCRLLLDLTRNIAPAVCEIHY